MPAAIYTFGAFEIDASARRLTCDGRTLAVADRHFDVLCRLVSHAGELVTKDDLVAAGWADVAVTDNSLEQAISALRRALGRGGDGQPYIETVPRRGYRFIGAVQRRIARATDESLNELMAPHRAWLEGRAALETLERDQVGRARRAFERVVEADPDHASAHIGLANACAMQFEMTRADESPDVGALGEARDHAREACRLAPDFAESWATLGFVLACAGQADDALAALRRAVAIEPDNWRHHFRFAYAGWGEERLRAARRTLALLPGFPLAHWLAATVHVARNALGEAERELAAGARGQDAQGPESRFNAVALHWLHGLVLLARGDVDAALAELDRELAGEASGQLYARECCANTWYAIGAVRLHQNRAADARAAFEHALGRIPRHPLARLGLGVANGWTPSPPMSPEGDRAPAFDAALCHAVALSLTGDCPGAARALDHALAHARPGNAGWLIPVEPLLRVASQPEIWGAVLGRLRGRSA